MPAPGARNLLLLGGQAIRYLLLDRFSSDQAAPLGATRTAQPGPGTWTVTDTESKFSVSGGRLTFAPKAAPADGDPGMWGPVSSTRVVGRAVIGTLQSADTAHICYLGWDVNQSGAPTMAAGFSSGANLRVLDGGGGNFTPTAPYTANTDYAFAVVLRGTGGFLLVKGGAYSVWTLYWVSNVGSQSPLFPAFSVTQLTGSADDFRVTDLGGIWASDYGIATNVWTSANAGTVFPNGMTPDAVLEHALSYTVASAANNASLEIRRVDADNEFFVFFSGVDGSIVLYERTNAVQISRASAAGGVSVGSAVRVVTVAVGNTYTVYVNNVQKLSYTDPSNLRLTATGIRIADSVITQTVAWPRYPAMPSGV